MKRSIKAFLAFDIVFLSVIFVALVIKSCVRVKEIAVIDTAVQESEAEIYPFAPNFIDLHSFCSAMGYDTALAYGKYLDWSNQILCIDKHKGLIEITQSPDGSETLISDISEMFTSDDDPVKRRGFVWVDRDKRDDRVSFNKGVEQSCPKWKRPIAIVGAVYEEKRNRYIISGGRPLCYVENTLTLMSENGGPRDRKTLLKWEGFQLID